MKNIVMLILGTLALLAAGCGRNKEAANQNVRGEWTVVNVNCPDILAEKGGVRRRFTFHSNRSEAAVSPKFRAAECRRVVPGWTVWVEAYEISFFPPNANKKGGE